MSGKKLITNLVLTLTVLCALVITGCRKDEVPARQDYTLTNHTDRPISIYLYLSEEDYFIQQHANIKLSIEPNASITVPHTQLQENRLYYMDWYSDNFWYHNWYNTTDDDFRLFQPTQDRKVYTFDKALAGSARQVFLDGDETQTIWQAVDAFVFAGQYYSAWDTMGAEEKYRNVVVNKNFTALYTYLNAGYRTDTLNYLLHRSKIGYIEFRDKNGVSIGEMRTNISPYASAPDFYTESLDTIMARFPNSDYYYLMVQQ